MLHPHSRYSRYLFPGAMNVTYVVVLAGVVINQGLLFAS